MCEIVLEYSLSGIPNAFLRVSDLIPLSPLDRDRLVGQLLTFAVMLGMVLTFLLECFAPTVLRIMGATSVNKAEVCYVLDWGFSPTYTNSSSLRVKTGTGCHK